MDIFEMTQKRTDLKHFNPVLIDGIATHELKDVIPDIENAIRQISHSFIDGFEFTGLKFASPMKEVERSVIRGSSGKGNRLKLDKNTTYMLEAGFRYQGEPLNPGFIRVPYVTRGGVTYLNGKRNYIHAVMVDRGVNIKNDSLYVYLNRADYTYARTAHVIRRNNVEIRDNVLTARLHQQSEPNRRKTVTQGDGKITAVPSIFLYLMMERGFTRALKDYFDVEANLVEGEYDKVAEQYPQPMHVIYSSVNKCPKKMRKAKWAPTDKIHLVFSGGDKSLYQEIAVNFFYLLDHFPTLLTVEDVDDVSLWKLIGGHFIFNTDETDAKLVERIDDHLTRSVGTLMDNGTRAELKMDNIDVKTIYELIAWLIKNEKASFKQKHVASVDNKRLTVARYTLSYITSAITRMSYAMELLKGQDTITKKKLNELIRKHLNEGLIRQLTKEHGEVRNIQTSTDLLLNITRTVVAQGDTKKRKQAKGNQMYKPENQVHPSMALVTQVAGMPKAQPNGREYVNLLLDVATGGGLFSDPKYDPVIKNLTPLLKR